MIAPARLWADGAGGGAVLVAVQVTARRELAEQGYMTSVPEYGVR